MIERNNGYWLAINILPWFKLLLRYIFGLKDKIRIKGNKG